MAPINIESDDGNSGDDSNDNDTEPDWKVCVVPKHSDLPPGASRHISPFPNNKGQLDPQNNPLNVSYIVVSSKGVPKRAEMFKLTQPITCERVSLYTPFTADTPPQTPARTPLHTCPEANQL